MSVDRRLVVGALATMLVNALALCAIAAWLWRYGL